MTFNVRKLQKYAISNSGLIFDPDTGSIFTANPTGLSILALLQSGLAPAEIKNRLAADYEVPDMTVLANDLNDFFNQLVYLNILDNPDD